MNQGIHYPSKRMLFFILGQRRNTIRALSLSNFAIALSTPNQTLPAGIKARPQIPYCRIQLMRLCSDAHNPGNLNLQHVHDSPGGSRLSYLKDGITSCPWRRPESAVSDGPQIFPLPPLLLHSPKTK